MAVDTKYGRVTTEHGDIGDDEPVVVFRGRDRHLLDVLDEYWQICEFGDSPSHHLDAIQRAKDAVKAWQDAHPDLVRTPNSDAYVQRVGGDA